MKSIFLVGLLFLVAMVLLTPAHSATTSQALITYNSSLGTYSSSSGSTITYVAGNTYVTNANTYTSSDKWVGAYGNVSGGIVIGSGGNSLFSWNSGDIINVIFAPTSVTASDLGNLIPANNTIIDDVNSSLDSGSDAWIQTFTEKTASGIGLVPANTSYTITNPTSSGFATFSLAYNNGGTYDLVWAGNVSTTAKPTFDSHIADYQVLLPAGTYNVFLELQ